MRRIFPVIFSLIGTWHIILVSAQESAASAIGRCTNEVRNKFTELGCPDANAAPCFCKNSVFSSAILDCSRGQGANADMVSGFLTSPNNFCQNVAYVKPENSAPGGTPTASAPAPSAPPSSTSTVSTPSSITTTPSPSPSPSPSSSPSSSSPSTTSSNPVASATRISSTSSSIAVATDVLSSPVTTPETAAGATDSSSKGLSQAAIAGIGIGIGAGVIAVAGIVICMLLKGRKNKAHRNPDNMEISKPLPGSGRTYPARDDHFRGRDVSIEKYGHDIEMTSNRYEDMVPRTQPRTLV